jgi:hypothetical protein
LDGSDDDTYAGLMSLSTDNVNIIPQNTCDSSGIGTGGLYNFVEVTNNTINLFNGVNANIGCYWDFETIQVIQRIPAEQPPGNYSINLTITITAE